jgi:hypothetical protein
MQVESAETQKDHNTSRTYGGYSFSEMERKPSIVVKKVEMNAIQIQED